MMNAHQPHRVTQFSKHSKYFLYEGYMLLGRKTDEKYYNPCLEEAHTNGQFRQTHRQLTQWPTGGTTWLPGTAWERLCSVDKEWGSESELRSQTDFSAAARREVTNTGMMKESATAGECAWVLNAAPPVIPFLLWCVSWLLWVGVISLGRGGERLS